MKKRLTVITLFLMLCTTMFGQNTPEYPKESWGELVTGFLNYKSMRGFVSIHGEQQQRTDLVVGAFCGDQLRAVKQVGTNFKFNLSIGGLNNDNISFAVYDQTTGQIFYSDYSVKFKSIVTNTNLDFNYYWNNGSVDHGAYDGMMAFTNAHIVIDGQAPVDLSNYELAAFCDGEVRSDVININELTFPVYGNDGDIIDFKLYDHSTGTIYESQNTYEFENETFYLNEDINFMGNSSFMVDGFYYNVLQNAISKAEGKTVTFIRDAEGAGVVIDNNVTIDFAGHTYTVNAAANESNAFVVNLGKNVTLKNGSLQVASTSKVAIENLIQNYALQLNLDGMKLFGSNLNASNSCVLSNNTGEVNITSTAITANEAEGTHYAFTAGEYAGYNPSWVIIRDNTTVNGKAHLVGGNIFGNTEAGIELVAEKSFTAAPGEGNKGWGTISTPIKGGSIIEESLPTVSIENPHDIYRYDEPTANWRYYKEYPGNGAIDGYDTFIPGQGYLYANKDNITATFEGEMNYASATIDVSYTEEAGEWAGFNLIGNPFASFFTLANITHNLDMADGFFSIDPVTGGYITRLKTEHILPMEAVMIKLNSDQTISRFKTQLIVTQPMPEATKRSEDVYPHLAINVSNAEYSDIAYISFNEGIGLNKINHRNEEIPMVSVSVDGADYAIAMMSQDVTEIPVSFKAAQMGEYTIGVEARDCEYSTMTLVDRLSGIETNLLLEDYTFIAKSGDNSDRFVIRLAKDNGSNNGSENFAYINNGMMFINNIAGQAVINVYDVTGRPVAEYNVAESASISTSDFAAGMYIIRMSDENGVKVQKIIVE